MNEQVLEDFLLDKIVANNFVTSIFEKPNYKVDEFNITALLLIIKLRSI